MLRAYQGATVAVKVVTLADLPVTLAPSVLVASRDANVGVEVLAMFSEFKTFLLKANVLALALAFILGVALAAVVSSLVKDIILPPVGLLFGGVDFNNLFIDLSGKHPASLKAAQDGGLATINYGVFINTVIVFIIVAFVVFLIARSFIPKAAPTKMCQFCGEEILASATRCRYCTSQLTAGARA